MNETYWRLPEDEQEQAATINVNKAALIDLMRYTNGQPRPYPLEAIAAFGQLCRDLLAAGYSPQKEVGGETVR